MSLSNPITLQPTHHHVCVRPHMLCRLCNHLFEFVRILLCTHGARKNDQAEIDQSKNDTHFDRSFAPQLCMKIVRTAAWFCTGPEESSDIVDDHYTVECNSFFELLADICWTEPTARIVNSKASIFMHATARQLFSVCRVTTRLAQESSRRLNAHGRSKLSVLSRAFDLCKLLQCYPISFFTYPLHARLGSQWENLVRSLAITIPHDTPQGESPCVCPSSSPPPGNIPEEEATAAGLTSTWKALS